MATKKDKALSALLEAYGDDIGSLQDDLKQVARKKKNAKAKKKSSGKAIASITKANKTYRMGSTTVEALKDVSLDIYEGEIVAIVGPSGSGKSTLMNLIGGLDTPTNGTIEVDGEDISNFSEKRLSQFRRKTIGFVFQFFYLQPFLDLQQNVEIPLMFSKVSRKNRNEVSQDLINSVGLQERELHLPRQLSGGQIQRTAIARALINKPKIVLADEPTGNLDSKNGQQIMDLFESIRTELGTTIIIVTHDEKTAEYADRVLTLEDGKLV